MPTRLACHAVAAPIIDAPCASHPRARTSHAGFTLIETLVATAVAAVLSGIAYPSFEGQLQRARRADALISVAMVQMAQERWRANARAYGSLAEIGSAPRSTSGHYTLQLGSADELGYEISATATGPQARDSQCRHLSLRMAGGNPVYASGPDSTTANPEALNRRCWSL